MAGEARGSGNGGGSRQHQGPEELGRGLGPKAAPGPTCPSVPSQPGAGEEGPRGGPAGGAQRHGARRGPAAPLPRDPRHPGRSRRAPQSCALAPRPPWLPSAGPAGPARLPCHPVPAAHPARPRKPASGIRPSCWSRCVRVGWGTCTRPPPRGSGAQSHRLGCGFVTRPCTCAELQGLPQPGCWEPPRVRGLGCVPGGRLGRAGGGQPP